ncbi:MAG: hypothetical protein RIC55_19410 [Pirellulaceae bacterium]
MDKELRGSLKSIFVMQRFRFSMRRLLVATALVAAAIVIVRSPPARSLGEIAILYCAVSVGWGLIGAAIGLVAAGRRGMLVAGAIFAVLALILVLEAPWLYERGLPRYWLEFLFMGRGRQS